MKQIPEKETITIEFKSDKTRLPEKDLIETVVGMANTDGGDIYLGVEDDGLITGLHKDHSEPLSVAALIANKTVPNVSVRVEVIDFPEMKKVLHIEVPISRTIVSTSEGKILRRRLKIDGEPECVPMFYYEMNSRLTDFGTFDLSAQPIADADLDDFDSVERARLRNTIRQKRGESNLLELSDEELDLALKLAVEVNGKMIPTLTGLLLIGKEERLQQLVPTAQAAFQVLQGTDVKINEQFLKPLLSLFDIFDTYMKAWNEEKEMSLGLFRIPIPEFDYSAYREALINSFCHRDYTILQMNRICIEDDGMIISNPGGFIEGVNLKNLLTVEPHGRNPALADALKRIGLAERTGRGIDKIYEGSIIYGRPLPDYSESTTKYVKLFFPRSKPDMAFTRMIYDEQNRIGHSLSINSLLILSSLRTERQLTVKRMTELTNIASNRAVSVVESLVDSGLVEARGSGRGRTYLLSSKAYKEMNDTKAYVLRTGIDEMKYKELILRLAKTQKDGVSRDDIMNLLNITGSQAYRLLKKLVNSEELVMLGSGRKTKYVLKDQK